MREKERRKSTHIRARLRFWMDGGQVRLFLPHPGVDCFSLIIGKKKVAFRGGY